MRPRTYQTSAIEAIDRAFQADRSTLIVLATGTGKTVVFSHVCDHRRRLGRCMVLAHREELIHQAAEKIEAVTGIRPDIEMASRYAYEHDHFMGRNQIVVSSIQTQISGKNGGRMNRFKPEDFALLVIDECFPAGTLIDKKKIEDLVVGDMVWSFNYFTGFPERKPVRRLFKKKASSLVRICFSGSQSVVCTPNHPIATPSGYVPALLLRAGDEVFWSTNANKTADNGVRDVRSKIRSHEPSRDEILSDLLFSPVQKNSMAKATQKGCHALSCMRQKNRLHWKSRARAGKSWKGLLLESMPGQVCSCGLLAANGKDQSKICLEAHAPQQSNAKSGIGSEDDSCATRPDFLGARRQRNFYKAAGGAFAGAEASNRIFDCYGTRKKSIQFAAPRLQGGHSRCIRQARNRSRWPYSSSEKVEVFGPSQRISIESARVDRVEILERGSDGTFGGVCPDGQVYNIEVEENHNYFASGLLVHNCHHAPSESYRRVIDYYRQNPELRVLGVTATPDRADQIALGKVFESVAFVFDIREAIDDGWLVPIQQQFIQCDHLDYSGIKTTAGDLNSGELSSLLEAERSLHEMVDPTIRIADGRKTLFFAVSVAQAERTCDIFNRHNPDSARCIFGHTPKDTRRLILSDYAQGSFQVLVNVGVATEGFDDPSIAIVAIGRPTKSRALYTQMIGRGTRPLSGIVDLHECPMARREAISASTKPNVLILDFAGNSGHHKLVTTADILGGVYPPDVVKAAEAKIRESNGVMPTAEALKEANWETQILAKLVKAQRLAAIKARAEFRSEEVDPFGEPVPMAKPKYPQHWYFKQASQKQLNLLAKFGVDASGMTVADASKAIDEIARNGWKRKTG